MDFPPVVAKHFRLAVLRAHVPDLRLAEFAVLRQGDEPVLRLGIKWWDFKSANRGWWGWPPNPYEALEEEYAAADVSDLSAADVRDVTAHLQPDGTLNWQAPAGRWTVLRFGLTALAEPAYGFRRLRGRRAQHQRRGSHDGFRGETDRKLSMKRAGRAAHLPHRQLGDRCRTQRPAAHMDGDFREQFRMRRGYDLLSYLPVLARRVVDGRETTERFLRDYRDTVADLLADYYGRLQAAHSSDERRHQFRVRLRQLSSSPHGRLADLQPSDRPMAEFWHPFGKYGPEYLQSVDIIRTAASGARIYGNRYVQAETLTDHPTAGLFTPSEHSRRTFHEAWPQVEPGVGVPLHPSTLRRETRLSVL